MTKTILLVVNFGGPRNQEEVSSFLTTLLTDEEVIRTPLPAFLQKALFRRVAKKRAPLVAHDYKKIGGGSPIFADTEWMAASLSQALEIPALAFHRYLESTHAAFLESLYKINAEEILVFPLFPQFSYATTGSIAKWFADHMTPVLTKRMSWIKSYPQHKSYVNAFSAVVRGFLKEKGLDESETLLFFSAHGLPCQFIEEGDVYQKECQASYAAIAKQFPKAKSLLAYQSKFGRGKWLEPSTGDLCKNPKEFIGDKKHIVFLPLSFSSDHIETLFEIEELYVTPLKEQGFSAYRCPALGRSLSWVNAAAEIIKEGSFVSNQMLIRR